MNNVTGRVTLFVLAGALAGLLTWFISDASGFIHLSDSVAGLTRGEMTAYEVIFMAWGGFIGILLGLAEAVLAGTLTQWPRIVGVGLAVGIVAGVIGGAFGMAVFGPMYVVHPETPFAFLRNVVARACGWAFIGALAGTASGWRKLSVRVGRNGLIGGFIGGILGGATFEIIPYLMPGIRPGPVARFFGFLITGAMIGLFVALVIELTKEAWIRVVVGRNEGREVLIDKDLMKIGRAELADITLFGDPNIARTHALIVGTPGGQFLLRDTGESPLGVMLNDRRVSGDMPLRTGDRIQIAGRLLIFYERATREPTAPERRDVAPVRSAAPASVAGAAGLPSLADLPGVTSPPSPLSEAERGSDTQRAFTPAPPLRFGEGAGGRGNRLVAIAGPYTGTAFDARPGAIIGRDAAVDIPLPADSKASRSHARFVSDGSGIAVEDMGSTNGTFVNGQRVQRQALVPGDTVVIGTSSFRLE